MSFNRCCQLDKGRLHLTAVSNPAPDPVIARKMPEWADIVFCLTVVVLIQ